MVREGSDITLLGWGAQLSIMEQACLDAEKVSDFHFLKTSTLISTESAHSLFFIQKYEIKNNIQLS